jgi:hypothetical protein
MATGSKTARKSSRKPIARGNLRYKTTVLLGQLFFCPPFDIQPLLLTGERTPRRFHPFEGESGLLVFRAFSKEGAVGSVISVSIGQAHTG